MNAVISTCVTCGKLHNRRVDVCYHCDGAAAHAAHQAAKVESVIADVIVGGLVGEWLSPSPAPAPTPDSFSSGTGGDFGGGGSSGEF